MGPIRVLYYEHPEAGPGGSRRSLLNLILGLGNGVRPYIAGSLPPEVAKDLPPQAVVWRARVGLWRRTRRGAAVKTLEWLAYAGSMAIRLAAAILRHRIDLVHVNNEVTSGAPAILAAMLTRRPCVCHLRGTEPLWRETRRLFRRVDHYIAISEHVRRFYADQSLLDAKAVSIIYNGVDIENLMRRSARGASSGSGSFRISMLGRMIEYKGHGYFLDAAHELIKQGLDVEFAVHGPVPEPGSSDYGYYDDIRHKCQALGLDGRVSFAGPYSDVAAVMRETDLVLCCSPYDNFGRIFFEAMACGVPVVAFDCGGIREVGISEGNCLLVPNGDASAMAAAAQRLIADPLLRERLVQGGRETADRLFDARKNADKVLVIYQELIAPRSRKRALTDPKRPR